MSKSVRYHPLFDCDVLEAARWYDRRTIGLGRVFANLVRQSVEDVLVDPDRFAEEFPGVRYARIRRFPYVLLFDVTETEVLILGVLHTARSSEKWRERGDDLI